MQESIFKETNIGLERSQSTSSPGKTFKILSIDGGGIKGLYPAKILQLIEEQYNIKIADQFDMICGTSTGGLIALALSIKKSASELVSLYQDKGQDIFPNPANKFEKGIQRIRQILWGGKYKNDSLQNSLSDLFGEAKLKDALTYLCIPSFNLTLGMPRVFKNPHLNGNLFKDADITMVDAALATSAAPSYLPIHQINNALYCDGGMWANNPSLCGLLEALDYFVGEGKPFDSYSILSLPTISNPTGWTDESQKRNLSLADWKGKILNPSMDGQAYFTDFFTSKIVNYTKAKGEYLRINQPVLSPEQFSLIALDNTSNAALKLLTELGDQSGAELISKRVFDSFITQTKHQGGQNNV